MPVPLAGDVAGDSAAAVAAGLADGDVAMLENIRFEPAETSKDDAVAGRAGRAGWRRWPDVYVGDGFGALHRKHASVYDLPALLPHAAGELVLAEVAVLEQLTESPARPYVVVLGGAKPSDKLAVIANLLDKADRILIGGGMSYTFLKAQGYEVGKSLLEADRLDDVRKIMADAAARGRRARAAGRPGRRRRFRARRRARGVPGDGVPGRPGEPGHGPGHQGAVRRQAGRRGHRLLERAGRGVRVPGVRRGHQGRGGGDRQAAAA